MTSIYANENFPLPAVNELRRLGHDVLTTYESGKAGQAIPDENVLEFACSQGRVLLTLNRKHFIRLHMNRPAHSRKLPGITWIALSKRIRLLAVKFLAALACDAEIRVSREELKPV